MMILPCLLNEIRKLRGTLALLLCVVAPLLVAIVAVLIAARQGEPDWLALLTNAFGLWAYLALPMTITALSALVAQVDHGARIWDHLFALPVPRGAILLAKVITLTLLVGIMSVLLAMAVFALGTLAGAAGPLPLAEAARMPGMQWAASLMVAVVQLWVALRFRSFVAPVALGFAGTFLVVAAMGAPEAIVLPWAMPLATLEVPGGNPAVALVAGLGGGLLLLPVMIRHLARRDY